MNENQDLLPSAWFDTLLKNNPENQSLDMLTMQPGMSVYLDIQAPAFVDLNAELEEAGGSSALLAEALRLLLLPLGEGLPVRAHHQSPQEVQLIPREMGETAQVILRRVAEKAKVMEMVMETDRVKGRHPRVLPLPVHR